MPRERYEEELERVAQSMRVREEIAYRRAIEEAATLVSLTDKSVRDEITEDYVEPTWRIEGLHIASSFTTITASKKTGKSTLMLNLMRSLVDGRPFLGQRVEPVTGKIGYWNLELDRNVWLQWVKDIGIQAADQIVALHLRGQRFPIYHPELYKRIIEWLKRNEIEVLIVDPGAKLLRGWPVLGGGGVENNNDVVAVVCQRLREMVEDGGVTDLFVPLHTGHNGGENQYSRGATVWEDDPDHLWNLWSKEVVKGDEPIRHFKAFGRNVDFDTVMLEYDKQTHAYKAQRNLEQIQERGWTRAIVLALTKNGPLGAAALRKVTKGISTDNFTQAVEAAVASGVVETVQDGKTKIHRLTGLTMEDL